MKRYSSYKDSGVEWIGEIPSHWVKGKWGYYFNSGMGQTILKEDLIEDGEIPVYSATEEDRIFGFINNPHIILDYGDLIIPARGNSIGHVKLVQSKSTTSQTTIYSKPKNIKISSKYTYYYCKGNKTNLFPFVQTAIPQITVNEISSNPIILPPLSEQQQIVEYLDEKTELIDTLIQSKQKKITLLKEKRTSLINQVVTKGLNPNVEMKDSGVEWIGEIPKGWEIRPTFYFCENIKRENTIGSTNVLSLSYGNIVQRDIETNKGLLPESFDSYQLLEPGCIVLRLTDLQNDKKSLRVGLCKEIGIITSVYLTLKSSSDKLINEYLYYHLHNSDLLKVFYNMGGGVRQSMSYSDFRRFPLLVPPLSEQQQIVEYLDKETEMIDKTVSIEERKIELLKEYKQSLISEVITGKRKVVSDE